MTRPKPKVLDDDDSPSVIGGALPPPPMPTRAGAELAWRELFAARLVERGILDADAAKSCAEAADVDLSVAPADAADDEVSYWDAD